MWFATDYNLRMASFKSKIRWKRSPFKRSASLTSVVHVGKGAAAAAATKGIESYCEDAAGEWEFVTKADVACYPSRRNSIPTSTPATPVEDDDRVYDLCQPQRSPAASIAAFAESERRPRPKSWLGALSQPFISEESLAGLDAECTSKLPATRPLLASHWLPPVRECLRSGRLVLARVHGPRYSAIASSIFYAK